MSENLNIPGELQGTFRRLINRVPVKLRSDSNTKNIIQLYLKLGGEKLAKQHIEIIKLRVREEERQKKAEADALEKAEALEKSDMGGNSIDPLITEFDGL